MKNRQVWLLADFAIIVIAALSGTYAGIFSARILPVFIAFIIGFTVFIVIDQLLAVWYYNGVPREKRFLGGNDEYSDRDDR